MRSKPCIMNPPSGLKQAAIYARVSTEDQGKGFSISTQIEACVKLAGREGYTVTEGCLIDDECISAITNPVVSKGTRHHAEQYVAPLSATPGRKA